MNGHVWMAGLAVMMWAILTPACRSSTGSPDTAKCSETALLEAAEKGNLEQVRAALDCGTNVNTTGENGWTPLHLAALGPATKSARLWASPKGKAGQLSLIERAMVRSFLQEPDDATGATPGTTGEPVIDAADNGGTRAWAAQRAVAELLLSRGAQLEATDSTLFTPLCSAILAGNVPVVELLLEKGASPSRGSFTSPLLVAVTGGRAGIAKVLIEKGGELEAKDRFDGCTPLHVAVETFHRKVAKVLLAAGANPKATCKNGNTALHVAAEGAASMVDLLLANGADPNAVNKEGATPLHGAARNGTVKHVKALLAKGARPDAKDVFGRTPLHYAVRKPGADPMMVELLLSSGASVNAKDNEGKTPLDDMYRGSDPTIQNLLVKAWIAPSTAPGRTRRGQRPKSP